MPAAGRLVSVNVGVTRPAPWVERVHATAIDKRPVAGPVAVGPEGLAGDQQADRVHHGGRWQAVYAFAAEELAFWSRELGRELAPGASGENLTVAELDVTGALIGERWAVGTAELAATSPRVPCRTFAGHWGMPGLIKRFTARGEVGCYLAVTRPGELAAGEPVHVSHRPAHGISVRAYFAALTTGDTALLAEIAALPELAPPDRAALRRRLRLGG